MSVREPGRVRQRVGLRSKSIAQRMWKHVSEIGMSFFPPWSETEVPQPTELVLSAEKAKQMQPIDLLKARALQYLKAIGLQAELTVIESEHCDPCVEFGTSGIGVCITEEDGEIAYGAYYTAFHPGGGGAAMLIPTQVYFVHPVPIEREFRNYVAADALTDLAYVPGQGATIRGALDDQALFVPDANIRSVVLIESRGEK